MRQPRVLQARACLVWPTVNLNCRYDQCDGETASKLRALPSWRGAGRNHLVFDYIDAPRVRRETARAHCMGMGTAWALHAHCMRTACAMLIQARYEAAAYTLLHNPCTPRSHPCTPLRTLAHLAHPAHLAAL